MVTILKKTLPLLISLMAANTVVANDAFDAFLESTTVDVKVRTAVTQLNANDVEYSAEGYSAADATTVLFGTGANAALALAPAPLNTLAGADAATVQANLEASDALLAGMNSFLDSAVGDTVVDGVEQEGNLDQAGSALWLQLESGYLYDIIGFDLGFQGALAHYKEDESSKLFIASQDDDTYSRISTARVKLRYGSEDVYVKGHYGYYSDADETDYLMDTSDLSYGASAHYNDVSLSYDAVTAESGNTESDYTDLDEPKQTIELKYSSAFGEASATREFVTDVVTTDTFKAQSGVPLSLMGLPIPEEKNLDYLLLGQVAYGMRNTEATDTDATQYEVVLAARLDGITLAASINNASDEGGAGIAELTDNALINDYDMFGQSTITYVARLDGSMFGLSGLSVSAVHLDSEVDKDLQLANGGADGFSYFLSGDEEFTETLIDASYRFQEGFLKGLQLRTVLGNETNQANVSGYGVFVDYDISF